MFGVWYTYCERRIKMLVILSIAIAAIAISGTGLFVYELYAVVKLHRELSKLEKKNKMKEKEINNGN